MTALEFHPLANIFPLIDGDDFADLTADIAAHGIHQPIDLYQGKILDGRNRYRAALAAGIELGPQHIRHFRPELYGEPLAYVISQNLKRRHLNESQRAFVAAKLANMRQGERTDLEPSANLPKVDVANDPLPNPPPLAGEGAERRGQACAVRASVSDAGGGGEAEVAPAVSQDQAAQMLNVSPRLVRAAKTVRDRAAPELQAAVEQGKLAVSAAVQAAALDHDTQRKVADAAAADKPKAAQLVIKQLRREQREVELGVKQCALPDNKYGVILADSEWQFQPRSRETGMDRAADNHYPTTSTDELCARDVPLIAADDCALFLWATAPMLPDALRVMAAWGFKYCTHQVWHKTRNGDGRGSGYWFTGEHELLLVGTKGKFPAPATAAFPSLIAAPWQGRHSAKPECFAAMIEKLFPSLPKIELNRRGPPRPGWDAWGNECEQPINHGGEDGGHSIGRHSSGYGHEICGDGSGAARVPSRLHPPDAAARVAQGRQDDRAGDVRYQTTEVGQEGQSATDGQAAGRPAQGAEAPGDPGALIPDSQANADDEIADTTAPDGESAGGVNVAASRLAGGRTPAPPPASGNSLAGGDDLIGPADGGPLPNPPPLAGEGVARSAAGGGDFDDPADEILELPNFLRRDANNRAPWMESHQDEKELKQ